MPRGSKPGERRGGRQRGTPNKATVARAAALKAASLDSTTTPLQFLLGLMRDEQTPIDLRVRVAHLAAPLVHGKKIPAGAPDQQSSQGLPLGFDMLEAKALWEIELRLARLRRFLHRVSPKGSSRPKLWRSQYYSTDCAKN
jgi:hypothetical protein